MITYQDLKEVSYKKQMKFALFCAMQVRHLMKDERSINAVIKLDLFIQGKITKDEIKTAANAAYASYVSADAAADAAEYIAYVAYVAADAADSSDAVTAYVAYVAADVAAVAFKDKIRNDQIDYFEKLKLEDDNI